MPKIYYLCGMVSIRHCLFVVICCFHMLSASATALADSISELPLPNVPATLRNPVERANYIIVHFWDALDFRDSLRSHNRDFMEQNFSNFISVFPYADEQARRSAVEVLLDKAEADSTAYILLKDVAEKYLYDPNSPMLSEDFYILFLERYVNANILGEYGTIRPRRQLDAVRKNRPGMTAADFAYTTRKGNNMTLHQTPTEGHLLLMFYDPDCEHCKETMKNLQADETLSAAVASSKLKVLAVYSGDDLDLWKHTAPQLPADWTVGYENGVLQENGSYVLRAMPTLYLLDANKKVVAKDVLPMQLMLIADRLLKEEEQGDTHNGDNRP